MIFLSWAVATDAALSTIVAKAIVNVMVDLILSLGEK
jgi:hypothetical protein